MMQRVDRGEESEARREGGKIRLSFPPDILGNNSGKTGRTEFQLPPRRRSVVPDLQLGTVVLRVAWNNSFLCCQL